ncbi:MAG: hypothetical protein JWL77_2157 [Chthonomonadaceae bacterium]|nr:hypothetical protein [Chthonomonadaceae bacterium]
MKQATPAIQRLAGYLLALEADGSEQTRTGANETVSALTKLGSHLTTLVGAAGFEALLARALALARAEWAWLGTARVQANGTLEGFREAAQQQPADAIAKASVALMSQLLGLLVVFIGEALTMRLVQDIWPEAQLDDMISGVKETSV